MANRKIILAGIQTLSGTSLLLLALLLLSIASNFYNYDRLTHERPVAELQFNQVDTQEYELKIIFNNNSETKHYLINGDEWQIDARIIKWHGWAQLLGMDTLYRLERLSGRYTDIEDEMRKERTIYGLIKSADEMDYWKIIRDYKKWLPWIDAYYGSSTYLPMADNAEYLLSITQTGLIARPINEESIQLINQW